MFFKIIAILFLILFLIKLINPKVFPFFKKAFDTTFHFIAYTFQLFIESSFYTIHLVFKRTVYVVGLDLLIAILMDVIITTISYPHLADFSTWFNLFKHQFINIYVFSFFVFTYVIGLLTYVNKKHSLNIFNGDFFKGQIFKNIKKHGTYEYDEKNDKYTYYD